MILVKKEEYILEGKSRSEAKDYHGALETYLEGLSHFPSNFHLVLGAAQLSDKLELYEQSLEHWTFLFENSERTEFIYLKLVSCLVNLNMYQRAREVLKEGILLRPNNVYLFPQFIKLSEISLEHIDADISFLSLLKDKAEYRKNSAYYLCMINLHKLDKNYIGLFEVLLRAISLLDDFHSCVKFDLLEELARNGWHDEVLQVFTQIGKAYISKQEFMKRYLMLGVALQHVQQIYCHNTYFDFSNVLQVESLIIDKAEKLDFDFVNASLRNLVLSNADFPTRNLSEILDRYAEFVDQVEQGHWIETFSDPLVMHSVTDWLKDRIAQGTPTSVIRLGDGEACFMPYSDSTKSEKYNDQKFIQNIWWGEQKLSSSENQKLEHELQLAIDSADLIGVPPLLRIIKDLQCYLSNDSNRIFRCMSNIYSYCSGLDLGQRKFTSAHIHTDMEKYEMYRDLLEDLDACTIISSHRGISKLLEDKYGIAFVEEILIPGEMKYAHQWSRHEEKPHFPFYFDQINKMKWEKGKVYLVAAGFLGKIYCSNIKKQGGISIDIGAIVDYWMGFKTRDFHSNLSLPAGVRLKRNIDRWNKNKALIVGQRRLNYFSDTCLADMDDPSEQQSKEYLITAHPRCGTKFISNVFKSLDIKIGHEQMEEDGISSWQLVAPANNSLKFKNQSFRSKLRPRINYNFSHSIHLVRYFLTAIPSIILENESSDSYNYRRAQIYIGFDVDLDDYSSAVEKALASYIYWNKLALSQGVDAIVRLEYLKDDLADYFGQRDETLIQNKLVNNLYDRKTVNSSRMKHINRKPEFTIDSLESCNENLLNELEALSLQFGYNEVKLA